MATVSKLIDIRLGTSGAPTTLTDLSAKAHNASLDRGADLPDATTYNSGGAKSYVGGLTDADLKCEFFWDAAIDTHLKGIVGLLVSFQYGEIGSTAGNPKTTGSVLVSKLGKPQKVGDVMMISVDGKVSGALVDGVYP